MSSDGEAEASKCTEESAPREACDIELEETQPDGGARNECTTTATRKPDAAFIELKEECCDLTVLPNGNVVFALGSLGIKEYRVPREPTVCESSWSPPKRLLFSDSVSTVACTTEGRLVVGLLASRQIMVLKKDPNESLKWRSDFSISTGPTHPYDVSVHGNFLAYTGNRFALGTWRHPGRHVSLVKLSDHYNVVLYKMMYFYILRVFVTSEYVIVLSQYKQSVPGAAEQFQLKAFNHGGYEMWNFASDERIEDICSWNASGIPGLKFCLAYKSSKRVGALKKENGLANPDREPNVWGFESSRFDPVAVSAQRNVLAILSADGRHAACIRFFEGP